MARCGAAAPARRRFRFKHKLVSLDSTMIEMSAEVFDWAKFRRTKGAVKLHMVLDHDGYLPRVAVITEGTRADIQVARTLRFEPGTVLVMDRGYVDYAWFGQLTTEGVVFVTRLKDNAAYHVMETRQPPAHSRVRRDEFIHPAGTQAAKDCPYARRWVQVWDPGVGAGPGLP